MSQSVAEAVSHRRRDRVPAEWLGKGRLFRQRVLAADAAYMAAIKAIVLPIKERLARKPTLREGMIWDATRTWQETPAPFRLCFDADTDGKHLTIIEHMLSASVAHNSTWDDPNELGIIILKMTVTTAGGFRLQGAPHSMISLHALARWQERKHGDRSDAALLRDIRCLLTSREPDRIKCDGGMWLSNMVDTTAMERVHRARDVRTFIPT